MGKRKDPRKDIQVPVRIFGTDASGAVFSSKAMTVNVSAKGAELSGVFTSLAVDETIGLSYGANRAHFRVKWIGAPGTPKSGHIGLASVSPEKPFWDFALPNVVPDSFEPAFSKRRKHPRFRCNNPVEIHVQNGASFWGTVADLSEGGCYVEMPIPLEAGTKLKVGIWIKQQKAWAEAEVAHKTPGLGIGIKFNQISEADLQQIRSFLDTLGPFARKREVGAGGASLS
jgi:hypothetical protein